MLFHYMKTFPLQNEEKRQHLEGSRGGVCADGDLLLLPSHQAPRDASVSVILLQFSE